MYQKFGFKPEQYLVGFYEKYMATTKERILITLTPSMARVLRARAKSEQTPRATIAARIIENNLNDRNVWLSEKEADALFRKMRAA